MKQKNLIIFSIPILILCIAIGVVFAYKVSTNSMNRKNSDIPVEKIIPPLGERPGKPVKGYGLVQGPASTSGSMLVAEGTGSGIIDLDTLLSEVNDAGETDLKSLDAVVNEL